MSESDDVVSKYHAQKKVEEIKGFMEMLKEGLMGKRKVVKTIPMKPEWKEKWAELEALRKEHDLIDRKIDSKRKAFWSRIEEELDEYRELQYNRKTGEIDVYEEEEEETA